MHTVHTILDSLGNHRLQIVETGGHFTRKITEWVAQHPDSDFVSVDHDFQTQMLQHSALEEVRIAKHCRFLTQDHFQYLSGRSWADAVFLDPPDLQMGLTEFLLALSTGAKVIVMYEYQTKAAFAIRRAKEIGWQYEASGTLIILRRPS